MLLTAKQDKQHTFKRERGRERERERERKRERERERSTGIKLFFPTAFHCLSIFA